MKRFYAPILIVCLLLWGCSGSPEKKEGPVYGGTQSDTKATEPVRSLRLENNKPELTKAELVTDAGGLRIVAEAQDKDGDPVQIKYAWFVNDKKVSEEPVLSNFKAGERIIGTVTPNDGKEDGDARSFVRELTNTPPVITPTEPTFDDPRWTMQVKAQDPDGDALIYSLKDAPSGMTIDSKSGLISWNTSRAPAGKHKATIQVSDGKGGTSDYAIEVNLSEVQEQ